MHWKHVVRRAAVLQLPFLAQTRALTTMTTANFTLDRRIFNKELYTRINDLWFEGVPAGAAAGTQSAMQKWYGMGSPQDKTAFDAACARHANEALESIGPETLKLTPFESYQEDEQNAEVLSGPLLKEVENAQGRDHKEAADVLLALMLLLDQMPRNIFRDQASLPKVYNHYDRLALTLLKASMKLSPDPTEYSGYAHRPVVKMWFFMPLMHSEDLSNHELWYSRSRAMQAYVASLGDTETAESMKANFAAADKHIEPLRKFGRYPHRNECLDRENTPEEELYLESAETFGVKQGGVKQKVITVKDEL